jgi:hypothetical protein
VKALRNESTLLNTQDLKGGKDPIVVELECL